MQRSILVKRPLFTSLVVIVMLVLAACGTPSTGTNSSASGSTAASNAASPSASGSAAAPAGNAAATGGAPKLSGKPTKVGFAQVESNGAWRLAQTASMQAEAKARGYELVYTDAGGQESKQISDVDSMIAAGVQAIFLAPKSEGPLAQAVLRAKAAGIPVILLDRNVDQNVAKAGQDYVTFIGSDFIEEGKRAAEWLIEKTGGNAKIIQLEGTVGSSPANDRKKGFEDAIKGQSGMQILASQTGDFDRDEGRQVMAQLLTAHPDVTAVYTHNDEMAIGAITALEAAGKVPGKDVTIVSIDGTKDALQAIIDGKLGATVECNPKFGPKAFDTLEAYANGEQIPEKIINPDKFFDSGNAQTEIANAY
jgi:ribose transport system substrate-binding protein